MKKLIDMWIMYLSLGEYNTIYSKCLFKDTEKSVYEKVRLLDSWHPESHIGKIDPSVK